MRIDWTAPARADLLGIVDHVLQHNPRAAASLEERISGAVAALAEHPARGRPGRVAGTRELVIAGTPYIVPYRIRRDAVQVLRVLHGARRWPNRL